MFISISISVLKIKVSIYLLFDLIYWKAGVQVPSPLQIDPSTFLVQINPGGQQEGEHGVVHVHFPNR